MNFKNAITMTTLSMIAVFAIASFSGLDLTTIDAIPVAEQPEKFVFVEKIATTAIFSFRDGTEIVPVQDFDQTGGFGTTTLRQVDDPRAPSGVTGRTTPSFTLEKIAGGTPMLYEATDHAQKYQLNAGMEYPYKFFDVEVLVASGGDVIRSFSYKDCKVTNYSLVTLKDNEEGYTGKGFAIVDQFSFECSGYTPLNPAMDAMKKVESAKTMSSFDLKTTDQWTQGFKVKP